MKTSLVLLTTLFSTSPLVAQEKPVIRLDDVYIEGSVRKPPVTEMRGSHLQEKVEAAALRNLIKLEKKLLSPLTAEQLKQLQLKPDR